MVSFSRLCCGLVAALVASVSSLEDNFRLTTDFLDSDHRYTTPKASRAEDVSLTKTRILEVVTSTEPKSRDTPGGHADQTQYFRDYYAADHGAVDGQHRCSASAVSIGHF